MKEGFLLDTNICVFLLRGKYDIGRKMDVVGLSQCYISEITKAELMYGAELGRQKGMPSRQQSLERLFSSVRTLPINRAIPVYAKEKARLRLAGTPADDDFDLLIGCTAIAHNMVMVTDNIKDFKNIDGITLENWVER